MSFSIFFLVTTVLGFHSYDSWLTLKTQCRKVTVLEFFFRWIFSFLFCFLVGGMRILWRIFKIGFWRERISNPKSKIPKKWILNPKSFQLNDLKSKIKILNPSGFKSCRSLHDIDLPAFCLVKTYFYFQFFGLGSCE